jgi:hypothetical protein
MVLAFVQFKFLSATQVKSVSAFLLLQKIQNWICFLQKEVQVGIFLKLFEVVIFDTWTYNKVISK